MQAKLLTLEARRRGLAPVLPNNSRRIWSKRLQEADPQSVAVLEEAASTDGQAGKAPDR